jgi:hypothetical protein
MSSDELSLSSTVLFVETTVVSAVVGFEVVIVFDNVFSELSRLFMVQGHGGGETGGGESGGETGGENRFNFLFPSF